MKSKETSALLQKKQRCRQSSPRRNFALRRKGPRGGLFALALLLLITFSLTACSWGDIANFLFFHTLPGTASTNGGGNTAVNQVELTAMTLQEHLSGYLQNNYDAATPLWQEAIKFWENTQGCVESNQYGTLQLCHEAISGNLQCVEFVTASYGLAGDPLPFIGNGSGFWPLYQGRADWKTMKQDRYAGEAYAAMTVDDLPQPGDMAAFGGGPEGFGHIAIVVAVKQPQPDGRRAGHGSNGSITLAQANAPGTLFTGVDAGKGGNFATFTWYKDGTFELHPRFLWQDEYLEGFIRHLKPHYNLNSVVRNYAATDFPDLASALTIPSDLPDSVLQSYGLTNLSNEQKKWVALAVIQATRFKLPPQYFIKQINQESGFNKNAISSAGARGIAQFMPGTAQGIPRCILNPLEKDPLNCGSHDSARGIDPDNPEEALPAAAYYMATDYTYYLAKCMQGEPCPADTNMAYARSLAAYNAGKGATDSALNLCNASWLLCMDQNQADHQTRNYIAIIMGCDLVVRSGAICPSAA